MGSCPHGFLDPKRNCLECPGGKKSGVDDTKFVRQKSIKDRERRKFSYLRLKMELRRGNKVT